MDSGPGDNVFLLGKRPDLFGAAARGLEQSSSGRPDGSPADSPDGARREELLAAAKALAHPQAVARSALAQVVAADQVVVDSLDVDGCEVDRVALHGTLLPSLFAKGAGTGQGGVQPVRVFPFLVTEGPQLAAWAAGLTDDGERRFAGALRYALCRSSLAELEQTIGQALAIPFLSCVHPGNLDTWPLAGQRDLFRLLAPWPERLGVRLLDDGRMEPGCSISGLFFASEDRHERCELCPSPACPDRKAPFRGAGGQAARLNSHLA